MLTINAPEIFNWDHILDYLERDKNEVMYEVIGRKVRRAFKVNQRLYLCEISCDKDNQQLTVQILNDLEWSQDSTTVISNYIIEWFDLDTSLVPFYQMAAKDDILREVISRFHGLRLVGVPDFYEAITLAILGQQINLAYTYTLKRRFVEAYGESLNYHGKNYWIYPEPKRVAEASIEELLELRLSLRKAEYILDITRQIVEGNISKEKYSIYPDAEAATKEMIKLRGIGSWTANYVLMRCLRMGDAFPVTDIGLLNGLRKIESLDKKPTQERVRLLEKQWGEWCSYATFYIWRILY